MTSQKDFSFSRHIAEIITGPDNQHVSITINGRTGSGKSNAAMRLASNVSRYVAEIKGGKQEDYFNINHVAIITNEEILKVMEVNKKYAEIIVDDAGVGMGSRNWQKEENKLLNNILMTMRTDNTCLIVTVPSSFMIDKIPRNLSHWFLEMESANFKKGFTTAKIFQVKQQPRSGKIYHMYPIIHGKKITRVAFKRAPDDVIIPYELRRTAIATQLKAESMEDYQRLIEKIKADKNPESVEPTVTKTERAKEFIRDFKAGVYSNADSMKEALSMYNKENKYDIRYSMVKDHSKSVY